VKPLERLGRNVKVRRVELDMTQEALAVESGIERSYMSGIERGTRNPSIITVLKIAEALKCDPADLLAGVKLPKGKSPLTLPADP
jgi:transcriptional regulator with XRE-family HTH domain